MLSNNLGQLISLKFSKDLSFSVSIERSGSMDFTSLDRTGMASMIPATLQLTSSRASFLQLLGCDALASGTSGTVTTNVVPPVPGQPTAAPVPQCQAVTIQRAIPVIYRPLPAPVDPKGKIRQEDFVVCDVLSLGFFPLKYWLCQPRLWSFRDLQACYFRARTSRWCKFAFKLWNSLKITQFYPSMFDVVGVRWVSPHVIMVDKVIFARFLEVKKATTAIFSVQGVLPTHGFVEIPADGVLRDCQPCSAYNEKTCRFYTKPDGKFTVNSLEPDVAECHYSAPSRE